MNWIDKITHWVRRISKGSPAPDRSGNQSSQMAQKLMHMLQATQPNELSCDEVYELLDQYAEIIARGEDAAQLMPLIKHHLDMCEDCREEYRALLRILEATPS